MPRKAFTDKSITLEAAGFHPRGAML